MVLHSWKAGPQTIQLQKQLEAMANGEQLLFVLLTIPTAVLQSPMSEPR